MAVDDRLYAVVEYDQVRRLACRGRAAAAEGDPGVSETDGGRRGTVPVIARCGRWRLVARMIAHLVRRG